MGNPLVPEMPVRVCTARRNSKSTLAPPRTRRSCSTSAAAWDCASGRNISYSWALTPMSPTCTVSSGVTGSGDGVVERCVAKLSCGTSAVASGDNGWCARTFLAQSTSCAASMPTWSCARSSAIQCENFPCAYSTRRYRSGVPGCFAAANSLNTCSISQAASPRCLRPIMRPLPLSVWKARRNVISSS